LVRWKKHDEMALMRKRSRFIDPTLATILAFFGVSIILAVIAFLVI
jgi:hypothetical protein